LKTIEQIEATIGEFDARLEAALAPFRDAVQRLKDIPGVSDNVAQTLIAEIGADMNAFATADHLVSWAGLCPRLDESAGRKRSRRLRKGAPWLSPPAPLPQGERSPAAPAERVFPSPLAGQRSPALPALLLLQTCHIR